MPDVIIWMLCGNERTAYFRIPAHEILYSPNSEYKGEFCNKSQTISLKVTQLIYFNKQKWVLELKIN